MESEERTVDELLAELQVPRTFGVETGEDFHVSGSAVLPPENVRIAEREARGQTYFAKSGHVHLTVTGGEMKALRRADAPGEGVQVIRSFKDGNRATTFSDKCKCGRWIHLGDTEHEATCFCDKTYRVVFDKWPEVWTAMARGMVCMDCGTEMGMSLVGSGLNPWHSGGNPYQVRCDACWKRLDESK